MPDSVLDNGRVSILQPETYDRCATCVHAELNPQDMNMINCWGAPPVPTVIGGGQNMAGQVQLNVQVLRPVTLPRQSRACGLHRAKPSIIS